MAMEAYYCYAVDVDGTVIDGVGDHTIDPGVNLIRPMLDGLCDPRMAAADIIDPQVLFGSPAIATLLDAISATDPLAGKTLGGSDKITMFLQKQANYGTRATGSSHLKLELSAGLLVPVDLSAGNEEAALLSCRGIIGDGGQTYTASSALAGTIAPDERYFAGPAKLNNVTLDGIQRIQVAFGLNLYIAREAGSAGPAFIGIQTRTPVVRITTTNAALLSTYYLPVAISAATHFYLRKGDLNGGRVAAATEEHIKITINAGKILAMPVSGAQQMLTLEIHPTYNGTNNILVFDTSCAIA